LFQKYGLEPSDRLIFYLGGYDLRKNVPNLIKAFGLSLPRLKELEGQDGGGRWVLALAGKIHSNNPLIYPDVKEPIRQAVGTGADADRVRFIGLVDEADKPLLYRAASFYVFPSRYEGFGLDPLEAIASGAPTICSDASSLPEVVGEAAVLVAPDDLAGWKNAIEELAARPQLRHELSRLGPLQAQKFSWDKTARRTLELYRMLECIETRGEG
jgi:glycosyltransferase involved in cell wall biosynthesis